ncbi:MAG: hypothetical protein JO042_16945 [Sinobacteraceae bacterium]|nr:hypothetical protein [Nevskiaceae bacterium]
MTRLQWERLAWVLGVVGLIGIALGWSSQPTEFPHAWLAALTAWLAWPLGSLGLLLIHALTGGRWGYALRPQLSAAVRTLWLLVPAVIPWLLTLPALYEWARPGAAAHLGNSFYLNRPFFFGRGAVYLVCWLGLGALACRAVQTEQPDRALARIAPGGLILLALTITFSAIDMTMSLDPHFTSSDYGLITIAEMGLFALAVAVFAAAQDAAAMSAELLTILGKLLVGLVLLWAYLDFMQLLILWESDLPHDAGWFLVRDSGGWGITAALIAATHFVLPWFALIVPRIRRSPRAIAAVTGLLAVSGVLRSWWLVVPASGLGFGLIDVAAMLCLLGIGAALSLREPRNRPPMPARPLAAGEQHGR